MKLPRSHQITIVLLIISFGVNIWQAFPEKETVPAPARIPRAAVAAVSPPVSFPARPSTSEVEVPEYEGPQELELVSDDEKQPAPAVTLEELIYQASPFTSPVKTPETRVTPRRLRELSNSPVPQAQRLKVKARLLLPHDQVFVLGELEMAPGQQVKFEQVREKPSPTTFDPPVPDAADSIVSPVKPRGFDFRETGVTANLEVTAMPGGFMLKGKLSQAFGEGFARMPGEAFSPIVSEDGTVLTDNKVVMPRFTTRESPFYAPVVPGQSVLIPVNTSFGETSLELTCNTRE